MLLTSTLTVSVELVALGALLAMAVWALRERHSARREADRVLSQLIETTSEAVSVSDRRNGIYLHVNDKWCEMFGLRRDQIVGHRITEVGVWSDPEEYRDLLSRLRKSSTVQSHEFHARAADGTIFICSVAVLVVTMAGREVVIAWGRDITELRRAEEALRESEETFRRMIETTPDAVALNDWREGTYLEVNDAWCGFVGQPREQLIGSGAPAEFGGDRSALIERLKREGMVRNFDLRFPVRGKTLIGSVSCSRFRVRDRDLVLTLVRDVTETRRMEAALRESEERFRTLTDSAPVGIFRADPDDRLLYVNPHWQEINGKHPDAVLGSDWTSKLHREDRIRFHSEREKRAATAEPVDDDFRFLHGNGELRWMHAYVMPLRDPAGAPLGFVGIERDITQVKALEQMRHDLVRMLTHDIRNPLAIIVGSTELLRDDLRTGKDPTPMLDAIESSADRAADLAQNFLEADRIDSGSLTLHRSPISINDMVETTLQRQAARARLSGVTLQADLSAATPVVAVDPSLFDRVLANLVSNALKFSPRGSTVRVTTRATDHQVFVAVVDQGSGIAPEDQNNLFKRYGRGAAPQAESTGLGLFVVRTIVEAHGGSVTVRNEPGGGAAFEVALPYVPT